MSISAPRLGRSISEAERRLAAVDEHPRLFISSADLPHLRSCGSKVRETARGILNAYLDGHRGKAPPGAGQPIRRLPDGRWDIDRDRLLGANTIEFTTMVQCYALGYLLRREDWLAAKAHEWLMAAARWEHQGGLNPYDNDLACAMIIHGLARGYDWLHPLLDEGERADVERALAGYVAEGVEMMTPSPRYYQGPHNNHAWWTSAALLEGALCLLGKRPEAASWLAFTANLFFEEFRAAVGTDGSWHEGMTYFRMAVTPLQRVVTLLGRALGMDMRQEFPWLRRTTEFFLYCAPPWSRCKAEFGDIAHYRSLEDVLAVQRNATLFEDGYAQWYTEQLDAAKIAADNGEALYPLPELYLAAEADVPARAPTDLPLSKHFRDVGWVAMHSEWGPQDVMLSFKSGPFVGYDSSHDHADQNHFTLAAFGERLVVDTGVYDWYGSPHFYGWYILSKAHNTILVDGEGQQFFTPGAEGFITEFLTCSRADYAVGDAVRTFSRLSGLRRYVRHLLYRRGDYLVIFDELRHAREVSYQWLLHSLEEMAVSASQNLARLSRGDAGLLALWLHPQELDYEQTNRYDVAPETEQPDEWHLTISPKTKTSECQFLTVLAPYRKGTAVDPGRFQKVVARGVLGVRSISPESSDWVLFAPSSGSMPVVQEVGPVRFQARMAALFGECDGRPEAFLASGATRLEESGRRLLSASRSVSAAVSYGSGRPSLFITAGLPAEVRIHWPWAAEDLAWATESEGASWEWDPSREELCLSLPEGEHGLVADPRQRFRRNGS